jgi:hypothetical protein
MTHLHVNPTLYEGTESLWPMAIIAIVLWIIAINSLRKGN